MEDLKNLVIKVKYPSSEKKSTKTDHTSQKTTVWNIKRLLIVFIVSVLLMVFVLFFLLRSTGQESDLKTSVATTEVVKTDSKVSTLSKSKSSSKNTITRALLTLAIKNNEPVSELNSPLVLPTNKSVPLYYFVEVSDMKDRVIFHEWWLGNKLINRKKITISNNDKWRTVSHQLVAFAAKNHWTVKVVDESGQLINELPFDIIEQQ